MRKIKNLFNENKMTLIVSLPKNDYEIAKTCWENGADAIKVHIDLHHNASKSEFKELDFHKDVFKKIIQDSPVPVGIVIGNSVLLAEKNMQDVIDMGFDFISLYGRDMPISLGLDRNIETFYALSTDYSDEEIISTSKYADIIEMSIMQSNEYGRRLTLKDLLRYNHISKISQLPTLLPTQLLVKPDDVKSLHHAGIKGIMIGAVVTGLEIEKIALAVKLFKQAILSLE
ncbi:hypothetical protein [Acholeplasma granularum]|uniref:hypothetical protein n=1 Tax=Acholeplasma granularum TaxID=264635 RepID=UPI000472F1B1|nr:hypothetical protein [Acholeplasma granularum]